MANYSSIGYSISEDVSLDGTSDGEFYITGGDLAIYLSVEDLKTLMIAAGAALMQAEALDAQRSVG